MDENSLGKYFYKAYETYMMLRNASQVDEQSDLKNTDVIRVQGFSKSLVLKILQMNSGISQSRKALEKFRSLIPECYTDPKKNFEAQTQFESESCGMD